MNFIKKQSLIVQIIIGLVTGVCLGLIYNSLATYKGVVEINSVQYIIVNIISSIMSLISVLGDVFIGTLKSIAPLLVFVLIVSALSKHKKSEANNLMQLVFIYVLATFLAALVAVVMSFSFPVVVTFPNVDTVEQVAGETSVAEVLKTTLTNLIQNPVAAIAQGNYLGILFWASLIGMSLRSAGEELKKGISQIEDALTNVIKLIISFAPIGIMGIVFKTVIETGVKEMISYGQLILILVGSMAIMLFIVDAVIVYIYTRENPYNLIFKCIKESGVSAFFTRSSAANIPINIEFCKKMNVEEELYSVSIPLGATINMTGAAITITVLTLAATNTIGVDVTFPMAIILSIVAALSACGASGIPGGSLLLLTTSTALFGLDQSIASQMIAIGYVIGVIQDSCETGLNSLSDAMYTIIVDKRSKRLELAKEKAKSN